MIMENKLINLVLNGKDQEIDTYMEYTNTEVFRKDVLDIMTRGEGKELLKKVIKSLQSIIGE